MTEAALFILQQRVYDQYRAKAKMTILPRLSNTDFMKKKTAH